VRKAPVPGAVSSCGEFDGLPLDLRASFERIVKAVLAFGLEQVPSPRWSLRVFTKNIQKTPRCESSSHGHAAADFARAGTLARCGATTSRATIDYAEPVPTEGDEAFIDDTNYPTFSTAEKAAE
jgi:hypothetical protein